MAVPKVTVQDKLTAAMLGNVGEGVVQGDGGYVVYCRQDQETGVTRGREQPSAQVKSS